MTSEIIAIVARSFKGPLPSCFKVDLSNLRCLCLFSNKNREFELAALAAGNSNSNHKGRPGKHMIPCAHFTKSYRLKTQKINPPFGAMALLAQWHSPLRTMPLAFTMIVSHAGDE